MSPSTFGDGGAELGRRAQPVVFVREDEGLTLILPQQQADDLGLPYDFVAAWITLQVHSALSAVGLTAAVSRVLVEAGISRDSSMPTLPGVAGSVLVAPSRRLGVSACLTLLLGSLTDSALHG